MSKPRPSALPYPVALPTRWSKAQRVKNTCIYGVLRAAYAGMRAVPWPVARLLAYAAGLAAWALAGRERRRAICQMQQAMPDMAATAVRREVRQMFVHLALSAVELLNLPRLLSGRGGIDFTPEHKATIAAAMRGGRGVVAVTGHIGNWELLAQTFAHAGIVAHTFAKPLYDPRLTAWVDRERRKHGLGVLWRGAPSGVKDMLRVFRRGEMLALLIDQDTHVEGCFVPFFGRLAHTPTAPASLALRFKTPIIFVYTHRVKSGHKLVLEVIEPQLASDPHTEIKRLTAHLSQRLQTAITQAPAQWVWLHDRWKQRPTDIIP